MQSPHTAFSPEDLEEISQKSNFLAEKGNQRIHLLSVEKNSENFVAIKHSSLDVDIEWILEVVFNHSGSDSWVAIRTFREADTPAEFLPAAKKPVVVRTLLNLLEGGVDGPLTVSDRPSILNSNDIQLVSDIILGNSNQHLPVVYVSCDFRGRYNVDVNSIANDLAGMAHVIVEPNRAFSYRLQIEVDSRNAYGGMIGIYWPNASGSRSIFFPREYRNKGLLKKAVCDTVRLALLNRRPIHNGTWSSVQEIFSRDAFENLKSSGSNNVDEYIEIFDSEQRAKDERILPANREIMRLQAEIKKYERQSNLIIGTQLKISAEQEFEEGEFTEVILDALKQAADNMSEESRRYHILNDIIVSNKNLHKIYGKR